MKLTLTVLSSLLLALGVMNAEDKKPTGVPASYPLKKCVVSDEPLGEMGKPVKVSHGGTDVYLCCKSCIEDFEKEPAKFVEKVKKAEKK
jgi:YHS domain-containing protein